MIANARKTGRAHFAIFSAVLFLSGCSALIFETSWLRLLGLSLSNAVESVAFILSSFMAGLALGNAIAASVKMGRVRPLQIYVILEIIVGISGSLIVFVIPNVGEYFHPLLEHFWDHEGVLNALRLCVSFVSLLIPTTAMGLSLPLLLEDELLLESEFGGSMGLLYGFNTLGALAGALIEEFFLVRAVGLQGSALVAGALNCVSGLIVWIMFLRIPSGTTTRLTKTRPPTWLHRKQLKPLVVSFGTGAALLSLEVVWFRFLRLYIASSPTAFAIVLAVVLAAIGLGGVLFGALHQRGMLGQAALSTLLLATAAFTLLTYALFPVPFLTKYGGAGWADFGFDTWWEIAVLSLALIFPVAFLSGMIFPAIVSRVHTDSRNRAHSVGTTTLFNTAGAAVGPLLAGFVLLPKFGFQSTLIMSAACYGLLALLASNRSNWFVLRLTNLVMFFFGLCLILVFVFFPYHRDQMHFAHSRRPFEADGSYLVKRMEGTADSLQLLRRDVLGKPYYNRLLTNAFSMSSTQFPNQRYMRLFAYLPLTLRPTATDALLICYGCGVTASALTRDDALKHIDVVDISKEVLHLAGDYPPPNPLADPRVTSFVQDGRFFLQACPRHYDVITGEPPPPKVAGTVNLYTREFFRLMYSKLKDDGIATFWLPIYQLQLDETKAILSAFHDAFPNASVWAGPDEEWIMMGIKGPGRLLDRQAASRLWQTPAARADLIAIGVEVPEQMPALFVMDSNDIEEFTAKAAPLTDMFPKRLSDAMPDRQSIHDFAAKFLNAKTAARRFRASQAMKEIWPPEFRTAVEPFFVVREMRYVSDVKRTNKLAELDFYLRSTKLREPVLEVLGTDAYRVAIAEKVATKSADPPNEALPDLVANALAGRDFSHAIQLLEHERAENFANRNDLLLLVYLYCLTGDVDQAERIAVDAVKYSGKDSAVDWLWGKLQAEYGFRPPRT